MRIGPIRLLNILINLTVLNGRKTENPPKHIKSASYSIGPHVNGTTALSRNSCTEVFRQSFYSLFRMKTFYSLEVHYVT
jgi:hypothetical protein